VASLGTQTCSGIPLAIEFSEGVSTSSSPVDGPGASLNLNVMEGMLVLLFWLGRVATTLCTAVGFGGLAPFVPALMLHFVLRLYQVPSEPLVPLPLCGPQLQGCALIAPSTLVIEEVC
jgi:hypothetical protein